MPPVSDIILIGAGRDPRTKQLRLKKQPRHRNRWIGTIQLTAGVRVPVTLEYVRQHFKQLAEAITDGVALVQYKSDVFVDAEELNILAFGSEQAQASYEKKISDELAEEAEALRQQGLQQKAIDDENKRQMSIAAAYRGTGQRPPLQSEEERLSEEELVERDANRLDDPQLNNLDGSHAIKFDDTEELAEKAARLDGESDAEGENLPGQDGIEPTDGDVSDPIDFKPLPEHWQKSNKTDLIALCEERGIDVSDAPSNRTLKERLDTYEASGA